MKSLNFFFALLSLPFCLANSQGDAVHQQLVALATTGNGVIKLDPKSFELLTSSKRNWSVSVQLTALDKRRRCIPCKSVDSATSHTQTFNVMDREFDPSFNAVAKAWASTPKRHRDNHFFATLDFDDGQVIFQKVRSNHIL
jgi:oligosaccharyltransferase complex subunit gamma